MMRGIFTLSLLVLTVSCAHKDASKGPLTMSSRSNADLETTIKSALDSACYIGYVNYFPDTREFYTALFFKDGREYPDDELLESKLDSVIVFDDDWGRERLPLAEAEKFLVLSGLDSLSIFNRHHEIISRSPLRRVEYLWNGIENYFIAVYDAGEQRPESEGALYGVTSRYANLIKTDFSATEFKDRRFDEYLVKSLKISRTLDWEMRHYKIASEDETYSIISSYSMQSNEAMSYLTSLQKTSLKILNKEVNNYHYLNILPLPVKVNGKPLLLISAGYPSSDVLWDYLAGFDGTRYEAIDYNRVPPSHITKTRNDVVALRH